MSEYKSLIPRLKDSAVFAGWIAGLILIAALCWFLTQNLRAQFLLHSVNKALSQVEESKRFGELNAHIPFKDLGSDVPRIGVWFSIKGKEGYKVLVFPLISGGNFLSCAAVVNTSNKVEDIVPLNSHAAKFLKKVPPGAVQVYIRRIEGGKN
ncbi:hypothetical protein FACS189447_05260 [Spirochaetia bacterium]|nr:hypothetical protein FACS189447_05260 [Spirochaetia bacterium]